MNSPSPAKNVGLNESTSMVDALVSDLSPAAPLRSPTLVGMLWAGTLWATGIGILYVTGGPRPGLSGQLEASVPYLAEILLGIVVTAIAIVTSLRSSVPGETRMGVSLGISVALVSMWFLMVAFGSSTAHLDGSAVSMLGKRENCEWSVLAFGLLGMGAGLPLVLRRASMNPRLTLATLAIGTAGTWSVMMQLGCLRETTHGLTHHLAPALGLGAISALVGHWVLRDR